VIWYFSSQRVDADDESMVISVSSLKPEPTPLLSEVEDEANFNTDGR
jgi:hypothetical protein